MTTITARPAIRRITTALAVMALALGTMAATARPVRAAGNDAGVALAGIAALAAIAIALDGKHQKAKAAPVLHPHVPPPRHHAAPPPRQPACVQTGRHGATVCGQPVTPPRAQVTRPAAPPHKPQAHRPATRKPQTHRHHRPQPPGRR